MPGYLQNKDLRTEWENLYKNIFRKYEREEDKYGADISHQNANFARAYLRLLPIAHMLQEDTSLHHLLPWQHHGVLDLFLRYRLIIRVLPLGENTYRLSFYDPNSTLGYAQVRPCKETRDVLLGKVHSLIQEELKTIEMLQKSLP